MSTNQTPPDACLLGGPEVAGYCAVFRRVEFRHKHSRFDGIDPCDTKLFENCRLPS
jgi:hypothetical protein